MNISKLSLRTAVARQKFANAKARGLKSTVAETGAIDLASIMVGVLVIGIVGGVIAATVFAVIPWAQDESAKQTLSAVSTAESVVYAQSSGSGGAFYLGTEGVDGIFDTDGLDGPDGMLQRSESVLILAVDADGAVPASYEAFSLSATGKVFKSTNTAPNTAVESALPTGFSNVGGEIVAD